MMKEELTYRPELIEKDRVDDFLANHPNFVMIDAFVRQIKELFFIDNNQFIGFPKEEAYKSQEFLKYSSDKSGSHVFIYYPWNNHIVKCVDSSDYYRLKTNRNQDLITAEEQKKLYDYRVAVLGMSVGSNIAFVLTQAGISREIYLADMDDLDTTNLNRILAGVHQIGLNKAVIAARRIYEDNPFAEVNILPEGIDSSKLESLLKNNKIDCIVEEVDDLRIKIEVRKLALEYKKPVVKIGRAHV